MPDLLSCSADHAATPFVCCCCFNIRNLNRLFIFRCQNNCFRCVQLQSNLHFPHHIVEEKPVLPQLFLKKRISSAKRRSSKDWRKNLRSLDWRDRGLVAAHWMGHAYNWIIFFQFFTYKCFKREMILFYPSHWCGSWLCPLHLPFSMV